MCRLDDVHGLLMLLFKVRAVIAARRRPPATVKRQNEPSQIGRDVLPIVLNETFCMIILNYELLRLGIQELFDRNYDARPRKGVERVSAENRARQF